MAKEIDNEINEGKIGPICNHFMVWNIQGGYSYYRCDKCNYIDGRETFKELEEQILKLEEWLERKIEQGGIPSQMDEYEKGQHSGFQNALLYLRDYLIPNKGEKNE